LQNIPTLIKHGKIKKKKKKKEKEVKVEKI